MALSVQDKLALMMTSAGSQRNLASLVGVSHQRIGRWLTIGRPDLDGNVSRVRPPKDPAILDAINLAFDIHRQVAREQSRVDGLPFDPARPAFASRIPIQSFEYRVDSDGVLNKVPKLDANGDPITEPGARVVIDNSHWLSDSLRDKILEKANNSGTYYAASVRSTINLAKYNKQAEDRHKRMLARGINSRDANAWLTRRLWQIEKQLGQVAKPVYTKMVPFTRKLPFEIPLSNINDQLTAKHAPATGEAGTAYADQILFQVDADNDPLTQKRRGRISRDRKRAKATAQSIARKARKAKR